jgi:hypothetical protein
VNWLTTAQSLLAGSSKSMTRAWSPAMEPSARRYSTVTPFTSMRCAARFRSKSFGASSRVSLRNVSSSVSELERQVAIGSRGAADEAVDGLGHLAADADLLPQEPEVGRAVVGSARSATAASCAVDRRPVGTTSPT